MKDSHLTLRLPTDLARALAQWARAHGVPKSQVAREAVTRYLLPAPAARPLTVTAGDLAARWASLPRLTGPEAEALGADIAAGRVALLPVRAAWE